MSPADDTYETARTFESLGVSHELNKALADEGIVSAFPIQALTVADALAGRDVCGKAKTGSGKTLAFGRAAPAAGQGDTESMRSARAGDAGPARAPGAGAAADARARRPGARASWRRSAKTLGLRAVAVYGGADIERQIKHLRRAASCHCDAGPPDRLGRLR